MISGRRLINKGWFEFDVGAGGGPVIGVKGSRNLTSKIYCNGGATLNFRQNGIIPGLVGSKYNTKFYRCDCSVDSASALCAVVTEFKPP